MPVTGCHVTEVGKAKPISVGGRSYREPALAHVIPPDGFSFTRVNGEVGDGFVRAEVLKYEHPDESADWELLCRAAQDVVDVYSTVEGKIGDYDSGLTNMSHSPGLPWRNKYSSKQAVVDAGENIDIWDTYQTAKPVWYGFPKFEILPADKAARKTRLITASPIELTVFVLRLLGDTDTQIMEDQTGPIACGKSKFYCGFDSLMRRFKGNVDEVDATRWDGSVRPREISLLCWIRFQLLHRDCQTADTYDRLCWAYEQLCYSRVQLSTGEVYDITGGMKSGCASTSVDNSLLNCLRLAYAYRKATGNIVSMDFSDVLVYGDDILIGTRGPKFWDAYSETGALIETQKRINIPLVGASFISCRVEKWGRFLVPAMSGRKLLYSACYMDVKPGKLTREERCARVEALWIEGFFSPDVLTLRGLYLRVCEYYRVRPRAERHASGIYFGLEVEDQKENFYSMPNKKKNSAKQTMPATGQSTSGSRPRYRRGPKKPTVQLAPVPITGGVSTYTRGDDSVHYIQGSCEVAQISNGSTGVHLDKLLRPFHFPRLKHMSNVYRQFRFTSVRFYVTSSYATSVGGNYILAFLYDADAVIPREDVRSYLTTSDAVTTNWYSQNVGLTVRCDGEWRYCVPGVDPRETALGKLVLWGNDAATEAGKLMVMADYTCAFRSPANVRQGVTRFTIRRPTSVTAATGNLRLSADTNVRSASAWLDEEVFSSLKEGDFYIASSPLWFGIDSTSYSVGAVKISNNDGDITMDLYDVGGGNQIVSDVSLPAWNVGALFTRWESELLN